MENEFIEINGDLVMKSSIMKIDKVEIDIILPFFPLGYTRCRHYFKIHYINKCTQYIKSDNIIRYNDKNKGLIEIDKNIITRLRSDIIDKLGIKI